MAFDFQRIAISQAKGEEFLPTPDGMSLDGEPVMFQYDGNVYVRDICIITKKKMELLISADGKGVEMRDEARKVFEKIAPGKGNDIDEKK